MALVLADRVKETTTTTGTGDISLAAAATGFTSFADAVGDGNTTYYAVSSALGSEFEVGIGTYTLSTDTLSRDTVLASSNSGSLVNFSAGTKDVFVVYPADKSVFKDESGVVPATTFSSVVLDDGTELVSETATLATTTETAIASFSLSAHIGAKLVVQITDSSTGERQISELLVTHDGTDAFATEYGVVHTGTDPLASFDVDTDLGNVRLLATAASSNSTEYKVTEFLMVA
jgi:hypothetical protein